MNREDTIARILRPEGNKAAMATLKSALFCLLFSAILVALFSGFSHGAKLDWFSLATTCGVEMENRYGNAAAIRWPEQVRCAITKMGQPVPAWVVDACISKTTDETDGMCLECVDRVSKALKCAVK